jgi:steroid delta-isomerase-like uncharacterized protein
VNAYVEMWNDRQYSQIPELVSESFVMYDPAAPDEGVPGPEKEVHGPDGLEKFIRSVVAGFPEFHVEVVDVVSSDDLEMYDALVTLTHEGEFDGIPPAGRAAELREMSKYRLSDGKIEEHRVVFDHYDALEQLGLVED